MSDTAASLRHKIASAGELEAVGRTMKAMAASSIGQYENAVRPWMIIIERCNWAWPRASGRANPLARRCQRRRRKQGRLVRSFQASTR
jgi:hypothetical protein